MDADWVSLVLMSNFTDGMKDFTPSPAFPKNRFEKVVSESILWFNAILPQEKVEFLCKNLVKQYLLIPFLKKSGF